MPKFCHPRGQVQKRCTNSSLKNAFQIDKLLTLSCNPRGSRALLTSIIFEPDVTSNICGIWLQGSFAFLNTVEDPHALLCTLIKRDPELGFLWLGAFITGIHHKCLRDARAAWWNIDLNAAAWTETSMSFIQAPVPDFKSGCREVSRADESRLLYLCHDVNYSIPPPFPFAPFGSTALIDTNLDVREHATCGRDHRLGYIGFSWICQGGEMMEQAKHDAPLATVRPKRGQIISHHDGIDVDYDEIDSEDENSEMVTRNVFTWLRGMDGFPVAERAIREHQWIDNLDDDEDDTAPNGGEVLSTVGDTLNGWILRASTQTSCSI